VLQLDFVVHGIHLFGGLQRLMYDRQRIGLVHDGNNNRVADGRAFLPLLSSSKTAYTQTGAVPVWPV